MIKEINRLKCLDLEDKKTKNLLQVSIPCAIFICLYYLQYDILPKFFTPELFNDLLISYILNSIEFWITGLICGSLLIFHFSGHRFQSAIEKEGLASGTPIRGPRNWKPTEWVQNVSIINLGLLVPTILLFYVQYIELLTVTTFISDILYLTIKILSLFLLFPFWRSLFWLKKY